MFQSLLLFMSFRLKNNTHLHTHTSTNNSISNFFLNWIRFFLHGLNCQKKKYAEKFFYPE